MTIGINRAVEVLATSGQKGGNSSAPTALKTLGEHPDGGEVKVYSGRYGPYVKHEKVNATIPKDKTPETITLEEAIELLAARASAGGKKKPAKKATAKKAPAKKEPAKKPASKKKSAG
jgi:DNA topoisomerase-1